jgi:hypothetical protein
MAVSQYWVGQKPARPLAIDIRGSRGEILNLTAYTEITVRLLTPDNEEADLTGAELLTSGLETGRLALVWSNSISPFEEVGDYVLQVSLKTADGHVDLTTVHTIRVRELGKVMY